MWRPRRFLQGVDFCWGVSFVEGVSWEIPDFRRYASFGVCVCFWQFPGFLSCCARFRKIQDFRRNSFATGEMGWRFLGFLEVWSMLKWKRLVSSFQSSLPETNSEFLPLNIGCFFPNPEISIFQAFKIFWCELWNVLRRGNKLSQSFQLPRGGKTLISLPGMEPWCLGDTHSSAATRWRGGTPALKRGSLEIEIARFGEEIDLCFFPYVARVYILSYITYVSFIYTLYTLFYWHARNI